MTSAGRREALEVLTRRGLSQRKACRYLELSRRVAGYQLLQPEKDRSLKQQLIAASQEVPRFGYRRMSAWLATNYRRRSNSVTSVTHFSPSLSALNFL